MTKEQLNERIVKRGEKIEQLLKVEMASQGLKDRALANRKTLIRDTKVFVDFHDAINLETGQALKNVFNKISISYPTHLLFYERGDAPKTRKGKDVKYTRRDRKPLLGKVLPIQMVLLRRELVDLVGEEIVKNYVTIKIPGIYSSR